MTDQWILGTDLRDGEKVAVPAAASVIYLDMVAHRERVQRDIDQVMEQGRNLCEMHKVPVPEEVIGLMGLNPDQIPDLPNEVRDQWGKQIGNRLESLRGSLAAEVLVRCGDIIYPLKGVRMVSFEQVLEARRLNA